MKSRLRVLATAAVTMTLFGCGASTSFVTSWKDPTAQPLEAKGAKVAAVAMVKDPTARKMAEDALAKAISEHGAQGIAMYTLVANESDSEAVVRAALDAAGVTGVVTMRPVAVDKETYTTPVVYSSPSYSGYYGGYYGYGWGSPWGPTTVSGGETYTDTIVSIETQIYSLKQNKLVWAGRSKTTNPEKVDQLVREVAQAVSEELQQQGLIKR